MTKYTKNALSLLMTILISMTLAACGSDDDDSGNGGGSGIVGTWSCDYHYYGGTDYFTFKSNGTYSWECPGSWHDSHTGHYTYSNGLLTVVKNNGTNWIYIARFSNNNTLILTDEDGDSYTYFRE